MYNEVFKLGDYISVNVGAEKLSGTPFAVGDLVGVLTTGSGSATTPVADGKGNGLGNTLGYASVALDGAFRVAVPAGTAYAVGDTVYVTAASGVISKTAGGNVKFGKVVAEPKAVTTGAGAIVVKIVQ